MDYSISVIVPCYNEEKSLDSTVQTIISAMSQKKIKDFEILVFNDASEDNTGNLAKNLSIQNKFVKSFDNKVRSGMGYSFRKGVELSNCDFCVMVPGDNELPKESLAKLLGHTGKKDMVISFFTNPLVRPLSRRIISKVFIYILNILFGCRLKYFNGHTIISTRLLRSVPIETTGHAYMASILIRLIYRGYSYTEIGILNGKREHGNSKSFTRDNLFAVIKTIFSLFCELRFDKKNTIQED
ncbi:MAG: glycosyltransferase family 2 protein [Nitrospinota bacterium]|nr:glycosyltransferase family 2 protein [Nitrospinota bacterium]